MLAVVATFARCAGHYYHGHCTRRHTLTTLSQLSPVALGIATRATFSEAVQTDDESQL